MKISIVTVVYNGERFIADALKSVQDQSHSDIEHIVIDGASTDGTRSIIDSFSDRIALVISERDNGLYDAMNKGIANATGDIIGLLNSDDIYAAPDILSRVAKAFADNRVEAVYGNLNYVKADDTDQVVRYWRSGPMYERFFEDGNVPPHPTLFLRRELYERFGDFDTDLHIAADYELMLRLFRKHSVPTHFINMVMVKMRLGGSSNKNLANIVRGNREIRQAWRKQGLPIPRRFFISRLVKKLQQFIARPD